MENLDIVRNPDAHRFDMLLDGERIGVIDYTQDDCVVTMTHTEISDDHSGKGFAARLVQAALADVRDSGEQVVPDCAYVRKYIGKHPEWRDLVAQGQNA
ncbi:MAG TPA: GNAT family N-acetyltransferase [Actinomycetota bacterium]|nr:GNAT family N-acetyltransferase [Actinomycetota bacterium]